MNYRITARLHNSIPFALLLVAVAMFAFAQQSAFADDSSPTEPPRLATVGPCPDPVEAPGNEKIDAAIARGIEFLVNRQEKSGAWGSPRRTKGLNIYAPVPGSHYAFQAAVTSLVVAALIESDYEKDDPQVKEAIDRGEAYLMDRLPKLRRADGTALYNNWGHAYGIQALVRMHGRHANDPEMQEQICNVIRKQIDLLTRYECVDGGWAYYDFDYHTQKPAGSTISFVTATVLVALHEAREIGIEIPERIVNRGKASILRQRKPDFSYCYGEYLKMSPMRGINVPGGSLGRSQACNLAMRHWGDEQVNDDVLKNWLNRLFARNGWLDIGRKRPVPHESWFQVAGYFYYYGHFYAALCIDELDEADRPFYQDHMAQTMLALQEKDGSWWDYPLYDYHQPYGTGYAIMVLLRCRHE